jgi:hypothetical protein
MNVEKFIRILGYIVYVILWSPVIAVLTPVVAIAMPVMLLRAGMPVREALQLTGKSFMNSLRHDAHFIKTGNWI